MNISMSNYYFVQIGSYAVSWTTIQTDQIIEDQLASLVRLWFVETPGPVPLMAIGFLSSIVFFPVSGPFSRTRFPGQKSHSSLIRERKQRIIQHIVLASTRQESPLASYVWPHTVPWKLKAYFLSEIRSPVQELQSDIWHLWTLAFASDPRFWDAVTQSWLQFLTRSFPDHISTKDAHQSHAFYWFRSWRWCSRGTRLRDMIHVSNHAQHVP